MGQGCHTPRSISDPVYPPAEQVRSVYNCVLSHLHNISVTMSFSVRCQLYSPPGSPVIHVPDVCRTKNSHFDRAFSVRGTHCQLLFVILPAQNYLNGSESHISITAPLTSLHKHY